MWGVFSVDGPQRGWHNARWHALPRSKPLRLPGSLWGHSPRWACSTLLRILGLPCTYSPGWAMHLLQSLLSICDTPGRYEPPRIPGLVTRQPAHSLVGDTASVAKFAANPCLLPLAFMNLPLCLQGGRFSSPLVFTRAQSFALWAHQRSQCGISAFPQKGLCFSFFVSLMFPQFGLLCHISPLSVLRAFNLCEETTWHQSVSPVPLSHAPSPCVL